MKLRSHQERGAQWLASSTQAGNALGFEQGLGKTLTVLRFMELAKPGRVLVHCPAIARMEWLRQIRLFYPEWKTRVKLASDSKAIEGWKKEETGIYITGYNPKLTAKILGAFDVCVLDEAQEISNPDVQTSKIVASIINRSEDTFCVPMSGTFAMDSVHQIWHIASLCQPGQWGDNIGWFKWRYLKKEINEWAPSGYVYKGLREDRRQELEQKIDSFMMRVRKQDVMADLPPLTVSLRYVKPKRSRLEWNNEKSFDDLLTLNSSGKLDATIELLVSARDSGETKFVVFTYLRQTAHECGARLRASNFEVEVVTGDIPADSRHAPIERIRQAKKPAALVCTIDSIGVALDFTFAQTAIFAEQHWQPGATSQALGRLHRLSSTHPVNCYFVVCEGTVEERKALAFVRKMGELEAVMKAGTGEKDVIRVLDREQTDQDILAELAL